MTIHNPRYYEEIVGKLAAEGVVVKHFILGASRETILKRLSRRLGGCAWAISKIDDCVAGFEILRGKAESVYIDTNSLAVEEVVQVIAERAGVVLRRDASPETVKKFRRLVTLIRHIRLWG